MRRGLIVHPDELRHSLIDRMAASGLTTIGIHPVGGSEAAHTLAQTILWSQEETTQELFSHAYDKGMEIELEAHALSWLLPRSLFSTHPDWFRMEQAGERTPDSNFCPSHPRALSFLTQRAGELFALLPSRSHRYFFWMDDVAGKRCFCPACRALSHSDQQLLACNAMLKGIRAFDPQAQLCYLAYQDTLFPPTHVQKEEGIFLEYAPFHRDPDLPLSSPNSPHNVSQATALPPLLAFFGCQGAQVLEYWMDNSMYSRWQKPPKPFALRTEVMAQDVPFYRAMGFSNITSFGCYLGDDYEQLHGRAPIEEYAELLTL